MADSLVGDVRYSIRSLSKSLTFTLGAGAVLALAIGATLAIFSVVNTVLIQPLAYRDAERIVSVETFWTNTGRAGQDVSGPIFLIGRRRTTCLSRWRITPGKRASRPLSATAPSSPTIWMSQLISSLFSARRLRRGAY